MKLALFLPARPDARWEFARQMGVRYAIAKLHPDLTGEAPPWDGDVFRRARDRIAEAGFTLLGLESDEFDMSRVKLGLDGRDEDVERYCAMLAHAGELGVRLVCYNFMASVGWFRTRTDAPARGGALTTEFDAADADKELCTREVDAQKAAAAKMYRMAELIEEPDGTETPVRRPVLR